MEKLTFSLVTNRKSYVREVTVFNEDNIYRPLLIFHVKSQKW